MKKRAAPRLSTEKLDAGPPGAASLSPKSAREGPRDDKSTSNKRRREAIDFHIFSILQAFAVVTLAGGKVPAAIQRFIARRIRRYLSAGGRLTLDAAFSLRSQQHAGSLPKRQATDRARKAALLEIAYIRISQGLSIEKSVKAFLVEHARLPKLPAHRSQSRPLQEESQDSDDVDSVKYLDVILTREALIRAYKGDAGRRFEALTRELYRWPAHKEATRATGK